MSDRALGAGLGLLICGIAVGGHVARGEPHLASVFPDVVGLFVAPSAVFWIGRRRRVGGDSREAVSAFGTRVGAIAGGVCAVGMNVFVYSWLTASSPSLWTFVAGTAFLSVFLPSCFGAYAAAHGRIVGV